MANIVYIATSLDGFIADRNGGIDWLTAVPNPSGSDFGFADFMKRIDGLVMGRKTYETLLTFDQWAYSKPVYVLSHTLKKLDPKCEGKAELVSGTITDVLSQLHARGVKNLYIDGGKTVQSFMKAGLIDELIITRVPIVLGGGIPLFGDLESPLRLRHVSTEPFENGLVKSHYVRG